MFILFIMIQLCSSYFLNIFNVSAEINAYIFIAFNMIFFFCLFKNKYEDISITLIAGYITRIIFLLWDVYCRNIFIFPGSGADSEGFYNAAISVSNNMILLKENIYGGNYSKILGIFFYFVGHNRILGQYLNVIFGIGIIILIYKSLKLLGLNDKIIKKSVLIISLFPNALIFSAILLRENIITFFITLSLYFYIKWYKEGKIRNQILSIVIILFASSFHSGIIGILIGYMFTYVLYDRENDVIKVAFKSLLMGMIFTVIGIVIFGNSNIFLSKFKNIKNIDDILNVTNSRRGGSIYLNNLKLDKPWKILLYSPIYMFYFLVSPLPWNWRGVNDIVTFFIDSSLYLIIIYNVLKAFKFKRKIVENKNIIIFLIIVALFTIFIFSIGVQNAGTAMRHRHKILPLLIILYGIINENIKVLF